MRKFGRFLRDVWMLATPYFRSEEKWSAWALLLIVLGANFLLVRIAVISNLNQGAWLNSMQQYDEAAFFRLLLTYVPDPGWAVRHHPGVHSPHRRPDRDRGQRPLPAPVARDPLAPLAHRALPGPLVGQPRLLPNATAGRDARQRQPGPADFRGCSRLRGKRTDPVPGPVLEHRFRHLVPAGAVGPFAAVLADRPRRPDPRVPGVGGHPLLGRRLLAGPLDRPAADLAELHPATPGGRFPLRPGAVARERRGRCDLEG